MAKKNGMMKIFGWVLVSLGSLGVAVPHIAFLAGMLDDLSTSMHAYGEIGAVLLVLVGAVLLSMKK